MDLPVTSAQVPALKDPPRFRVVKDGGRYEVQSKPQSMLRRMLGGGRRSQNWVTLSTWPLEADAVLVAGACVHLPPGFNIVPSAAWASLQFKGTHCELFDLTPRGMEELVDFALHKDDVVVIAEFS